MERADPIWRGPVTQAGPYPNLACILARPIDWALVEQQYNEFVRYSTAMAERTADPEAIRVGHVSPYGTFDLDMEARLDLEQGA